MRRRSRMDAPGALHPIIARGIEQGKILRDDSDRNNFLERLGEILEETKTPCWAWASIPNHIHLLLKTGQTPVAALMRRLLPGSAVSFNRRHRRYRHLFQNRYKSIRCQEDAYLLEWVRYIHLNRTRDSSAGFDSPSGRNPGYGLTLAGKPFSQPCAKGGKKGPQGPAPAKFLKSDE